MGGFGSGRGQSSKDTTSDFCALDVRRLQRDGLLLPSRSFRWSWTRDGETMASIQVQTKRDLIVLNYRHKSGNNDWRPMNFSVGLSWTGCSLGGRRAWFLCPARGCSRRVALLYVGSIFACRHCHRLAYASQREADYDRAARRADKIRARLGWDSGFLNAVGGKPKGMRWSTFEKLTAAYQAYVDTSLAGAMRHFGIKIDV